MSQQSTADSVVSFVLENKLKTILYTWGAGITGSLVRRRRGAGTYTLAGRQLPGMTVQCCVCQDTAPGSATVHQLCRQCAFLYVTVALQPARHALPQAVAHPCPCTPAVQAYEWSRPIPGSLKIIHSRVYAQVRRAELLVMP